MQPNLVTNNLSLREAFGQVLVDLAPKYEFLVLDGDMAGGTGVWRFRKAYPDRYLNCGIAEQNMMGTGAGINLATGIPIFVTGFATFLMRAWEIARISIAYNNANVKIVASHVGLDVGPDGHSAQCFEDVACWRAIDNMVVIAPCDPQEVYKATEAILNHDGPVYMRTGRSAIEGTASTPKRFRIGKGILVYPLTYDIICDDPTELTIIAYGITVHRAIEAAKTLPNVEIDVINMSTIKPLDVDLILSQAEICDKFLVVEDHHLAGGLGEAVSALLDERNPKQVKVLCMPNKHGESGEPKELAAKYGLDTEGIIHAVKELL